MYWIPVTIIINATAVTEKTRFLAFNFAAYIWQVTLAAITNGKNKKIDKMPKFLEEKSKKVIKPLYSLTTTSVSLM